MTEDSDLNGVGVPYEEAPTIEEPVQRTRSRRPLRLAGIALLALLIVVAVILLTPGLRKGFLPQIAKLRPARVASHRADPAETLPAVPVLWERLDLGAMSDSAAQELGQGKYYYDKRLPGNFGLAISYWKKAQARLEGTQLSRVEDLVASAERELARHFSADSADAFVLLKQGKLGQAVYLLERMRADYPDINSPQYRWASQMLYRRRR